MIAFGLAAGCSSDPARGAVDAAPAERLTVEYVAHACFRMTGAAGTTLLIDPYASKVWLGYDFPDGGLAADAVAITHPHYDHDHGEFIGREVPWGEGDVVLRAPADGGEVGEFVLTGLEGEHAGPYGDEFGKRNTPWIVEHAGLRLLHWGDNGPVTDALADAAGRIDVLFLPIDGAEHLLSFDEVAAILERLAPRIVVPMHYRIPDLEVDDASPEDLGPIDPWLDGRDDVRRLGTHRAEISLDALPDTSETWVFDHDPVVTSG